MKLDMLPVRKGLIDTTIGSDTGRHIGIPLTPTALMVSLEVVKFMDFIGFRVELESFYFNLVTVLTALLFVLWGLLVFHLATQWRCCRQSKLRMGYSKRADPHPMIWLTTIEADLMAFV